MVDAAANLLAGGLVAFPTETVYGLGADACNADAVARIYAVKGRPADHPLIVHIASMSGLGDWADDVPEYAIALARDYWPGPMTLVVRRSSLAGDFVTGGQDTVGVRVPNHPVALGLLEAFVRAGGKGVAQAISARDQAIAEAIGPVLAQRGLLLIGLDVIGDCLTEINVTSPTCFQEIFDQTGFDVAAMFIDALEVAAQK